jgi:iron(III) transport system permease protein
MVTTGSETIKTKVVSQVAALGRALKENSLSMGIGFLLLWLVAAPIIMLILSSLRSGSFIAPGSFTLNNYHTVYLSPLTYPALINSIMYAGAVSTISLSMSSLFAWLVERTDMPFRNWAWTMMLLPLAMPGILSSMAWILMLSPRTGVINVYIREILMQFGSTMREGPFNIFTMGGMIFVEAIRGSTTLFLLMVGAFRLMDPSMEEAARISGAGIFTTLRRVTIGLMLPAVLAAWMYSFLGNLEDFDTPLFIGLQAGIYLLPTLIYFTAYVNPSYGVASAYSSIFIILTVLMVWIYYRVILRHTEKFAAISGKNYRPRRHSLGRWRWVGFGFFLFFSIFSIIGPFLILLWASLMPNYMVPSREALQYLTLENFVTLIKEPMILKAAINTGILAILTATGAMTMAFVISWSIVRVKVKGRIFLDALSFIPHAIPTISIALALIVFYLHPALHWMSIYGTLWIMMLAMITRYLAFATRTSNAAMTQLHPELEEAGLISGASRIRTFGKITFPLLLPAFIGGWVWVCAHTIRTFSIPLMLSTPETQTVAVVMYYYWERKADFSLASTLGVAMFLIIGLLTYCSRSLIAQGFTKER